MQNINECQSAQVTRSLTAKQKQLLASMRKDVYTFPLHYQESDFRKLHGLGFVETGLFRANTLSKLKIGYLLTPNGISNVAGE